MNPVHQPAKVFGGRRTVRRAEVLPWTAFASARSLITRNVWLIGYRAVDSRCVRLITVEFRLMFSHFFRSCAIALPDRPRRRPQQSWSGSTTSLRGQSMDGIRFLRHHLLAGLHRLVHSRPRVVHVWQDREQVRVSEHFLQSDEVLRLLVEPRGDVGRSELGLSATSR